MICSNAVAVHFVSSMATLALVGIALLVGYLRRRSRLEQILVAVADRAAARKAQLACEDWGQAESSLASGREPMRLEAHRLRYWTQEPRMGFKDTLGDTPWTPPPVKKPEPLSVGKEASETLAQRYPELTTKLRAAAVKAESIEGGPITSAEVWQVLDDATREQAKKVADGRIMSVAFDGDHWEQTGRYHKKGSRGRPIAEWRLKTRNVA